MVGNAFTNPWTDERIEKLKALHREGLSASQIAKAMGGQISRNAVIGKINRMGWGSIGGAKPAAPAKAPRAIRPPKARPTFGGIGLHQIRLPTPPADPAPAIPERLEDVTGAKPLFERGFGECCAPVAGQGADTLYCCRPVEGEDRYRPAHRARFFIRPKTGPKDLARTLRRAVA